MAEGFFWGVFFGLSFVGAWRFCFDHTFTVYDSRRGWVLKWESADDDWSRGYRAGREDTKEAPSDE